MKNTTLCPFLDTFPADAMRRPAPPQTARPAALAPSGRRRRAPRRLSEKARMGRCIALVFALTLLAVFALIVADLQTPAEAHQDAAMGAPSAPPAPRKPGALVADEKGMGGLRVVVQKGHTDRIGALAASPDGRFLVSGGDDRAVKIWDVETGLLIRTIETSGWALSLDVSPDGKVIASGEADSIRFYGMDDGAPKGSVLKGMSAANYRHVRFLAGGREVVAVSTERRARVWRIGPDYTVIGDKKGALIGGEAFVGMANAVAVSPDKTAWVLGANGPNSLRVYRAAGTDAPPRLLTGHVEAVNVVAFSPNGAAFASAGNDKIVRVWNAKTGALLDALQLDKASMERTLNDIESLSWSPDGARLAALSMRGTAFVWQMTPKTGKAVRFIKGFQAHRGAGKRLLFMPGGASAGGYRLASTGGFDDEVRVWDADTGTRRGVFASPEGPSTRYYYAGADKNAPLISCVSDKNTLVRQNIVSGEYLPSITVGSDIKHSIVDAGFSMSGKYMAYTCGDDDKNLVRVVDLATAKEVARFDDAPLPARGFSFSPDDKYLSAVSRLDYQLKIWNLDTGKAAFPLLSLSLDLAPNALAFSPNGKMLAALDKLGEHIELWDLATGKKTRTFAAPYPDTLGKYMQTLAWSPNGDTIISSDIDGELIVWNVATGKDTRRINAHKGWTTSLAVSPDGKFIASSGVDRVLKVWGLADGKLRVMRFSVTETDWVVVTPDGRFDGTEQGVKEIHYVRANQPIPLESFFERFFTPRLLAQVLTGAKPVLPTPAPVSDVKLPPRVRIVSPLPGVQSALADVIVSVEVTDQGGGIAETLLYQNGKLINRDTRALVKVDEKTGAFTKTFNVTLLPGANVLRATAFNKDRTESAPSEVTIALAASAPAAEGDLYIVAVGINGYVNPKYRLTYAAPDARSFTEAVEASGKNIFRRIVKTEVFDDKATRANIEAALLKVAETARPQDAFVLYYSGHGVMSEGAAQTATEGARPAEFFLACADLTQFTSDEDLLAKGISATRMRDLCLSVKAQKQLIILDACQSGGAVDVFTTRGVPEEKAIAQLARSAGVMVLSAALSQQVATELTELKHGVFTYALMQGLRGEADGGKTPDGKITVGELRTFVSDRVPELSKKYQSQAQYPSGFSRGQDFPLGVTVK